MSKWHFPDVRPGDTVRYSPGSGDGSWVIGIVSHVGNDQLACYVFDPIGNSRRPPSHRDGVVHKDDPRLTDPRYRESLDNDSSASRGIFDVTLRHTEREKLQLTVASLQAELSALNSQRATSTRRKGRVKDESEVATV